MKTRMRSAMTAAPMPIPALAPVERLLDWGAGMGVCSVEVLEFGVVDEDEDGDGDIGDVGFGDVGFGGVETDMDEGSDADFVDCVVLEDWIR
jgi:hypothetical protein